jgi:inosine-uridine nucleoside N-ribohydrolase
MKKLCTLSPVDRLEILDFPKGKVDIVLDTDAFNEIDDQFAIAYALLSPEKINVKAIYAAPFFNPRSNSPKDGMEKSYKEIKKLMNFMGIEKRGLVYRGSDRFMDDKTEAIKSDAARDLIERCEQYTKENPLYVVAIGALTNIASAIIASPEITDRICIVWLGGHAHHMLHTREFNMKGDLLSSQIVFGSGVPLVQLPCMGVVSELYTTVFEMKNELYGKNELCSYLSEIVINFIEKMQMKKKVIWDISAIAYLLNEEWIETEIVSCPIIENDLTYAFDIKRHKIKVAKKVNREEIFSDLFNKLTSL